jgi:uncharacterized protein
LSVQPSRYNIYLDRPEGSYIYNGVSGTVTRVHRRVSAALQAGRITPSVAADSALTKAGIITARPGDQLRAVKRLFAKVRKPTDTCTIVVNPTTRCNLRCPYCYEHASIPEKATMTRAVARRTSRFICREMDFPERKRLLLKYYGGEPLLEFDTCRRIAEEVDEWCQEHKKELFTWVQTNGTLITDKLPIEQIPQLRCVEITLDGSERRHNRIRIGKSRAPTYRRIIDAIHSVIRRRIGVSVRINMHTAAEVSAALADLERYGVLASNYVIFYDGQVSDSFVTDKFASSCPGHIETDPVLRTIMEVRGAIQASGWGHKYQRFPLFLPRTGLCSYGKPGNYCIDPKGQLFSCVFHQSRPTHRVGTIAADGTPRFTRTYEQIINRSPFDYEECVDCPVLPQCWGGCFAQAIDHHGTVQTPSCGTMRTMVPAMLNTTLQEKLYDEALKVQRVRAAR